MYTLSAPISLSSLPAEGEPAELLSELVSGGVNRVFICYLYPLYSKSCEMYSHFELLKRYVPYFKEKGFETGVWISGFGHGGVLTHAIDSEYVGDFTRIVGYNGKTEQEAFCPLDKGMQELFAQCVKDIAGTKPDMIMFDDDFRFGYRSLEMACTCELHLKEMARILGEDIKREELESLAFTGGANRYRDAWMKANSDSLYSFAALMREAVDSVDPSIRLGACACCDAWDYGGTDVNKLARIFAGNTRPFVRTIGAPYHSRRFQNEIERTRLQASWTDDDIELFTEGDVYPRPRYAVPSRFLELFDLALIASGETDGILKYMFDYNRPVSYEKGYNARHIKNAGVREALARLFEGKSAVGVRIFEPVHQVGNMTLPEDYSAGINRYVEQTFYKKSIKLMSENAVPTTYSESTYPTVAFGEAAKYLTSDDMKNGVIIDGRAADFLSKAGIDTGVTEIARSNCRSERYVRENDSIPFLSYAVLKGNVSENSTVLTRFEPSGDVASYLYENGSGIRFLVYMTDMSRVSNPDYNYFNTYYRGRHLTEAVEWLCGKPLPAKCEGHPYLYTVTSKGADGSMSVALFNMHDDDIIAPEVILDGTFNDIRTVNCGASLDGNTVALTDIAPYSFAAFEVKK